MKNKIVLLLVLLSLSSLATLANANINLTQQNNLFVRISVPKKGIVCSNHERANRVSKFLKNVKVHKSSWGPMVYVGEYKNQPIFVASAPVGAGSGLVFTELYAAGAEYIIRYGSDDVVNPKPEEKYLVKIIDETDNLYGFNRASGVSKDQWGKSVFASNVLINALTKQAEKMNLNVEKRICHHLENYHALRYPEKYGADRENTLKNLNAEVKRNDKKESWDMESAVLFRVALDFNKHATAVLQTVNKENPSLDPYAGKNLKQAIALENSVFINYLLTTLVEI